MLHCVWRLAALQSPEAPIATRILSSNTGQRGPRANAECGNYPGNSPSAGEAWLTTCSPNEVSLMWCWFKNSKCLALIAQMDRALGMNPKVGGSSHPQVVTFSVSKTLNIRSCVENECCCPCTVNISNVNFNSKYIYTTRASVQIHGTANVWPW